MMYRYNISTLREAVYDERIRLDYYRTSTREGDAVPRSGHISRGRSSQTRVCMKSQSPQNARIIHNTYIMRRRRRSSRAISPRIQDAFASACAIKCRRRLMCHHHHGAQETVYGLPELQPSARLAVETRILRV